MLLNHGADPNAKDTDDNTPLHLATRINDDKQVEMLLNHGAAVNAKNEDGNTPLHEAAKWKNAAKTTEILLKNGADPNAKDIDGKTPLHIAAANCSYIMGQLLSNGAKVLAKDEYGKTPLMAAGDLYTFRKLFESTWFSKLLGKLGWAAWAAFLCLIITIGFFDDRFDSVYFLYVAWGFGSLSVLLLIIIGMICMAKKEYEKIWKARKNWRKN